MTVCAKIVLPLLCYNAAVFVHSESAENHKLPAYHSADSFDLQFIEESEELVLDTPIAGTGFEGGSTYQIDNGDVYLFTAEFRGPPIDWNMRIVVMKEVLLEDENKMKSKHNDGTLTNADGFFSERTNLGTTSSTFAFVSEISKTKRELWQLSSFSQTCGASYCPEKNQSSAKVKFTQEFECLDKNEKNGAPWAPIPLFDRVKKQWKVYSVTYACDFTEQVLCGEANIHFYESAAGRNPEDSVKGPWLYKGIVVGPSASDIDVNMHQNATKWGNTSHDAADFVDELSVFEVVNEVKGEENISWFGFTGENHFLAMSNDLSKPWKVTDYSLKEAISIETLSPYAENPIVTRVEYVDSETNKSQFLYVAVFDAVFNEHAGFGVSFSTDALQWTKGKVIPVEKGCRTPLGLTQIVGGHADPNLFQLHFTRRHPYCNSDEHGTNVKTKQIDNCGGFGGSYPTMCAPLYKAKVKLLWNGEEDTNNGQTLDEVQIVA